MRDAALAAEVRLFLNQHPCFVSGTRAGFVSGPDLVGPQKAVFLAIFEFSHLWLRSQGTPLPARKRAPGPPPGAGTGA
jgi:hypothetical protein